MVTKKSGMSDLWDYYAPQNIKSNAGHFLISFAKLTACFLWYLPKKFTIAHVDIIFLLYYSLSIVNNNIGEKNDTDYKSSLGTQ